MVHKFDESVDGALVPGHRPRRVALSRPFQFCEGGNIQSWTTNRGRSPGGPKNLQSVEAILLPHTAPFLCPRIDLRPFNVSYVCDVYIKSTPIPAAASINVNIHPMANIEGILQQLRDERDQLDRAINALSPVSHKANRAQTVRIRRRGRRLSAASIAKMRAAQHARRARESQAHSTKNGQPRARRRISPAGLARIRAAQRARWAKVRATKKKKK
jgi:hypothetical protein